MKKLLLAALVAGSLGGATLPASADVVVRTAPPPPRDERIPEARRGYVWAPGHWEWRHGRYAWTNGKWLRERHGYDLALLEGYRSPVRQERLAASGSHVSNARAFQSYHQYGLAADCAFVREGRLVISERDSWAMHGYRLYGEVAEAAGMVWGGRWTMMDFGHTELRTRDARA